MSKYFRDIAKDRKLPYLLLTCSRANITITNRKRVFETPSNVFIQPIHFKQGSPQPTLFSPHVLSVTNFRTLRDYILPLARHSPLPWGTQTRFPLPLILPYLAGILGMLNEVQPESGWKTVVVDSHSIKVMSAAVAMHDVMDLGVARTCIRHASPSNEPATHQHTRAHNHPCLAPLLTHGRGTNLCRSTTHTTLSNFALLRAPRCRYLHNTAQPPCTLPATAVIEQIDKPRESQPKREAIYFLTPTQKAVDLLGEDFQKGFEPKYKAVHIYFTQRTTSIQPCATKHICLVRSFPPITQTHA